MSNFSSAARLRLNIHAWALLVLVIIEVLTNFLSDNLTVGQLTPNEQLMPHRLLYDLWLGVIILGLLAAVILWTLNNSRRLRVAIFLLNGVFTVQLLVATVLIVVRLAHSDKVTVTTLLLDGVVIFVTNSRFITRSLILVVSLSGLALLVT